MKKETGVAGFTGTVGKERLCKAGDKRVKGGYIDYLIRKSKNIKIFKEKIN